MSDLALFEACRTGDLEWFRQQQRNQTLPRLCRETRLDLPHELVCQSGHLELLQWMVLESGQRINLAAHDSQSVCFAAEAGHLDILKWIVYDSGQIVDLTTRNNYAVRYACLDGHFEVVKWLVQEYSEWLVAKKLENPGFTGQPVDITARDSEALVFAAEAGHLNIVRWLIEDSGQPVDVTAENFESATLAAANQHHHVLEYLRFVTPLIQAIGLTSCREIGFDVLRNITAETVLSRRSAVPRV